MKKLFEQIMKFGVVGVLSFAIDYGIYCALCLLFHVPVLVANFFGFTISVIFNYIMSMKFVFERRDDMSRQREFIIFMILSIIGLGINVGIMYGMDGRMVYDVDTGNSYAYYDPMRLPMYTMNMGGNSNARGYSRHGDTQEMKQELQELMNGTQDVKVKEAIQTVLNEMNK